MQSVCQRKEAGSHLGGFTAFELDVTDLVTYGKTNQIALSVTSESIADATSNASNYAVHPLGGITRDIYLFALPEVNFSMFHATTSFDSTYTDAILKAEITIANESKEKADGLTVNFILKDAAGKIIPCHPPPLRCDNHQWKNRNHQYIPSRYQAGKMG